MPDPKTGALPLGYDPKATRYSTEFWRVRQVFIRQKSLNIFIGVAQQFFITHQREFHRLFAAQRFRK